MIADSFTMEDMFRKLWMAGILLIGLGGCQHQVGISGHDMDRPMPKTLVLNYIMVHGMCMGYLRSHPDIIVEKFKQLSQLDLNAKYYILLALRKSDRNNLQMAQQSVQNLLGFINHT